MLFEQLQDWTFLKDCFRFPMHRVSVGGFVPPENESPGAVPNPDSAGTAGGIGSETMGNMVDAMDAVMHEDQSRAAEDLQNITANGRSGAVNIVPPEASGSKAVRGSGGLETFLVGTPQRSTNSYN